MNKKTFNLNGATQALIERSRIESNKQFKRLNEKTQVLVPENGMTEVTHSRLTHSYEVATSAKMIASFLAEFYCIKVEDIDYKHSIENASLLHVI